MNYQPTYEAIRISGYEAFIGGLPRHANPYDKIELPSMQEKMKSAEWFAGWLRARREAEDRT